MRKIKRWRVKSPNYALQQILSTELGISNILAQLLINRRIYTVDQARAFLGSELDRLFSPWLMKDMEKAVERILKAKNEGEKILIYGDYDVDGITGTTVLVLALRKLGCRVEYFIPHRLEEGYGLNKEALERAAEQGVTLIVTVDCGISGVDEVKTAKNIGLDVVITDHHEPPALLPEAVAVLDPKRHDCGYPFKELAGVGVALKLIQGLYHKAGLGQREWEEYIDLVCLGTVADIVPLQGENRILVKQGLIKIANTCRAGLQALIKVSGIKTENIGTRELGFGLAPRLNAAGRMGDATLGVELLLATEAQVAEEIADTLNKGNQERQQVEAKVLAEALALLESDSELTTARVLVLASTNWHPGVIGIVASRLVDRFYRPVFMISIEDGKGKGSARSIPGFNLYQAMVSSQEHLGQFGGHAMAAGFSIDEDKINDFRRAVNSLAIDVLTEDHLIPNLDLDALVNLTELSMDAVQELDLLSPYGHCNPGPMLGCCEATVINCREVGKNGAHLKMRVRGDQVVLDGIGFNLATYSEMLAANDTVDMAFVPSINVWNGRSSVQLEVKELKEVGEVPPEREDVQESTKNYALLSKALQLTKEKVSEGLIPVGTLELCRRESPINEPTASGNRELEIVDHRDCPDRIAELVQILHRVNSSLVMVESTAQAIQVATFLSQTGFPWSRQVAVYHPQLRDTEVKQLAGYLNSDQVKILVTTNFSPLNNYSFEQIVFFHLPYLYKECNISNWQGSRVILLGGKAQSQEAQENIKAMAPEREALGELYKLLRLKVDNQGQGQVTIEEICQCLRGFYPRAAFHTVEIGLNIFRELGLIEFCREGNNYTLQINFNIKSDLQNSSTYKWALHTKEECLSFQNDYLSATPEQLIQLFSQ